MRRPHPNLLIVWLALAGVLVSAAARADETGEVELLPLAPGAEAVEVPGEPGLEWTIVPFVAGSTDVGVAFGVIGVLADLAGEFQPYAWRLRARLLMSVRDGPRGADFPEHNHGIQFDLPGRLGGRLRLTSEVAVQRWSTIGYFGIGNATRRETDAEIIAAESREGAAKGRRYQHTRTEIWAQTNARLDLSKSLALVHGFQLRHVIPSFYGGSLLDDEATESAAGGPGAVRLHGTSPHWIGQLSLGILIDTRDNEVAPRSGGRHEIALRVAPGSMMGHKMTFAGLTLNARFYATLIEDDWLVLAGRVFVDLLFGTVPYHELASGGAFERMHMPGGREGIRGVPVGRYHGRVKLIGNMELRTMFATAFLGSTKFRFGAVAFLDAGRIWADYKHDPERDGTGIGLKYGVGLGPRVQWGETVMLRLDISYSPDAAALDPDVPVGIYAGLAHSF